MENRTSLYLSSLDTQARDNNIISYNKLKHSTYFKVDQRGTTLEEINFHSGEPLNHLKSNLTEIFLG